MAPLGLIIIFSIMACAYCHGNHDDGPKLLLIYTNELTEELKSLMLNKVNVSMDISRNDDIYSIVRYITFGCEGNVSMSNCNKSCLPIWTTLRKQKLKSSFIGLPNTVVFGEEWPPVFYGEDVFKMGLTVVLKQVKVHFKRYKMQFVMMCVHGANISMTWSVLHTLIHDNIVNVILVTKDQYNSQVFITGPSFVSSIESQYKLKAVDLYLFITKVFKIKDDFLCHDGNLSLVSMFMAKDNRFEQWTTLIIVSIIIGVSLAISFIMIIMSIMGVRSRKNKSNRFNLGARNDNPNGTRQLERNYLLDSSDDEELFSGSSRDPRLPTLLKIDDNLSEIALH